MNEKSSRLWIGLFVALVFVCGLSLGFAASMWLASPSEVGAFRGPRGPGGPGGPRGPRQFITERIINALENDPDFTDEQRTQLEALFEERQERLRTFNREMRERFESARASLREDIAAILTPAQMEIFDAARRRGRPRRGPPTPDRR